MGVGIALTLFTVWVAGCVVVMCLPQWVILSIPLGRLGAARLPLSSADRSDRRDWCLAAALIVGLIAIPVLIGVFSLIWLESH
jgi:hypothetical protein